MTIRTELRKCVTKSIDNPFGLYYKIIASRDDSFYTTTGGDGGCLSDLVVAEEIDGHYLLMKVHTVTGYEREPFGIVELNKPKEALKRMYEEAKRLGREIAKFHENKLVDLTR